MPNIRIKQMEDRTAAAGIHFGLGRETRKLEVGEVVALEDGDLFDAVMATGKVELTADPVTRPLTYADANEAAICSPSFKIRSDNDEAERNATLAAVAERLAQEGHAPKLPEKDVAESAVPTQSRAERRAARRGADG